MSAVGLIIGSIHDNLVLDIKSRSQTKTPFGLPSSPVLEVAFGNHKALCILRHGETSNIPPHMVNYRANIWALREHGVRFCIALSAVGTLDPNFLPGELASPEQLVDYTWGREHSFCNGGTDLRHVDFTCPFDKSLREQLISVAKLSDCFLQSGVYGVTQGPRLETASEIDRLEKDGCTMVGMTAMPEAGLAKELNMSYAICAMAVNFAAGRGDGTVGIHNQIERYISKATGCLSRFINPLIAMLDKSY